MIKKIALLTLIFVSLAAIANAGYGPMFDGLNFSAPTVAGKGNIYQPEIGAIVYDSSDEGFYGRTQSGTWTSLGTNANNIVPAGSIMPYAGTSAPTGWLLCDGSAISRTTYSDLFAVVGTAFGSGDGSTTFKVPDLRGRFLRGVAGGQTTDPDRNSRTAMSSGGNTGDNVGSIQGYATARPTTPFTMSNGVVSGSGVGGNGGAWITGYGSRSIDGGGDAESRPVNAYVNYIIKY